MQTLSVSAAVGQQAVHAAADGLSRADVVRQQRKKQNTPIHQLQLLGLAHWLPHLDQDCLGAQHPAMQPHIFMHAIRLCRWQHRDDSRQKVANTETLTH